MKATKKSPLIFHARAGGTGQELVTALTLPRHKAVLLLNGGAGLFSDNQEHQIRDLIEAIARAACAENIIVIDGGTQSGIMQLMGEAMATPSCSALLVGVCPASRVRWSSEEDPDANSHDMRTPIELNHTHIVLTPGESWGDETPYMFRLAEALSIDAPSLAILINGGDVARQEILYNVRQGREIVIIEGSGRLADKIVQARLNPERISSDQELAEIIDRGHLTHFAASDEPDLLETLIHDRLHAHNSRIVSGG